VKNGLLRDYLQEKQGTEDMAATGGGPGHEVPMHGEVHTIAGGFSGGGCTASQRRRYARTVMSVEAERTDDAFDINLVFTKADLEDVVPHDNDLVVIPNGNRRKEGAPCVGRSGKLNKRNVLHDFQQTATIPRHAEALW